jgi:hypothetical protein
MTPLPAASHPKALMEYPLLKTVSALVLNGSGRNLLAITFVGFNCPGTRLICVVLSGKMRQCSPTALFRPPPAHFSLLFLSSAGEGLRFDFPAAEPVIRARSPGQSLRTPVTR